MVVTRLTVTAVSAVAAADSDTPAVAPLPAYFSSPAPAYAGDTDMHLTRRVG